MAASETTYHNQQQQQCFQNSKKQYIKRQEELREYARQYNIRFKLRADEIIGNGVIKCVKCRLSDHQYLEIDHIDGRGSRE